MGPEEFIEKIKKTFDRVVAMPEWMQPILFEDINATIENRVRTMEMIVSGRGIP